MFIINLLLALFFALIFTLILGIRYQRLGPWHRIEAFFVILFLATWAVGLWITPFGPQFFGAYWVPFFLISLIFALLLAATPSGPPKNTQEAIQQAREQTGIEMTINYFFWVLVFTLIFTILGYYLVPQLI